MSEGMWDGASSARCPHGNFLALEDKCECGCHLMLVTADNLIIYPGPYDPDSPRDVSFNLRHRRGLQFPVGVVVPRTPRKKSRNERRLSR